MSPKNYRNDPILVQIVCIFSSLILFFHVFPKSSMFIIYFPTSSSEILVFESWSAEGQRGHCFQQKICISPFKSKHSRLQVRNKRKKNSQKICSKVMDTDSTRITKKDTIQRVDDRNVVDRQTGSSYESETHVLTKNLQKIAKIKKTLLRK